MVTLAPTRRRCRPLRREDPDALWFVTTRTIDEVFWLHPLLCSHLRPANRNARRVIEAKRRRLDAKLERIVVRANKRRPPHQPHLSLQDAKRISRDLVASSLARAQKHCAGDDSPPVEVYAVTVMSNHLHLVLRAPAKNLAKFMGYFKARLAQGINLLLGRTGNVFYRRYDAQPVLDHDAAVKRVAYTVQNPVTAGLVRAADEWPGFLALAGLLPDEQLTTRYFERTQWHRDGRPDDRSRYWRRVTLTLHKLPGHDELTDAQYARTVLGWMPHENGPNRVLGVEKVLAQDIDARPARSKRSPRPYAFGADELVAHHLEAMSLLHGAYDACMNRLRAGHHELTWPEGTYAPGYCVAA